MKHLLLSFALSLCCCLSALAEYVNPFTELTFPTVDGRFDAYIIDETERTAGITWVNTTGDVVFPSTITVPTGWCDVSPGEYKVTRIECCAFQGAADQVTSITIPGSIELIGPYLCLDTGFPQLKSITFEESEKPVMLYRAFYLTNKGVLENVTINRPIITDYDQQYDYTIYNPLAFLPDAPNGVTVTIGSKVTELCAGLFESLTNVKAVTFTDWNKWYNDVKLGDVYSSPYWNGGAKLVIGGIQMMSVPIPDDAVAIPDYKIAGMDFGGELILPSGLKRIGAYSFWNQKNLYYMEIPDGVEHIGDHAFDGCEILDIYSLPTSLKTIGNYAFRDCDMVSSVTLPDGIEEIGEFAFANMDQLNKAVLFSDLTEVPVCAFSGCKNLSKVYLPKNLKTIGNGAFMACPELSEISLPEGLEKIGIAAFAAFEYPEDPATLETEDGIDIKRANVGVGSRLSRINFPQSLKEIGTAAFYGCQFAALEFNEGLEKIGQQAFDCSGRLSSVSFPLSLKVIGARAFATIYGEHILSRIELPVGLEKLGKDAFMREVGEIIINGSHELPSGCLGHAAIVTLPASTKKIEAGVIDNADGYYYFESKPLRLLRLKSTTPPTFAEAPNFTDEEYDKITVVVPDGTKAAYERNPRWSKFNLVEETSSSVIVHVTGEAPISEEIRLQSNMMPSRVVSMKVSGTLTDADFRLIRENMISLVSLDLSAITNTAIPSDGLCNMPQLTEIILPPKLESIGFSAFKDNTLMDTPALPAGVKIIHDYAFWGCPRLSITELPAGLTTLGKGAFVSCSSLRYITAGDNLTTLGNDSYNGIFASCTLLESVDFSATKIECLTDAAFSYCTNLREVLLPETLTSIGESAFANTALAYIDIPQSVNVIGQNAFEGTTLRTLTIPGNISSIESKLLANCPRLVAVSFPSTVKAAGKELFSGSNKLTAISCSAIDAPEAQTGAFTGMRVSKCALIVPTVSFRSYLNAPQWGMFSDLLNRITVEIPEDTEVTSVDETEYQEIVEEEALEEELETPDAGEEEAPESPRARIRRAVAASRASMVNGSAYAALFNGATLSTASGSATRIFVNAKPGSTVNSILLGGLEKINELDENNSLVIPAGFSGSLQILSDSASIDEIAATDDTDAHCVAYDLQGRQAYAGTRSGLDGSVAPGIYVVKTAKTTTKVVVK